MYNQTENTLDSTEALTDPAMAEGRCPDVLQPLRRAACPM